MADEIILGQVYEKQPTDNPQIALLEPLYIQGDKTDGWLDITDVEREFPNRGKVTWIRAPDDAIVGSLWWFTYEQHPSFDPSNPKHDRYRINWKNWPKALSEVIDIQAKNAEDALRKLDKGLDLRYVPAKFVYIVLDSHSWAGPVKLIRNGDRWWLDSQQRNTPIARVSTLSEKHTVGVYVDSNRVFLRHDAPDPPKIDELEWAPDTLVLQRLLNEARRQREQDVVASLGLTKAAIQGVLDSISGIDTSLLSQRLTRATNYVRGVERMQAELATFEQELLALPAIRQRIAKAEQEGRDFAQKEAETAVIAQAKVELDTLRQEREKLANDLGTQQAELDQIQVTTKEARAAVELERQRYRAELCDLEARIEERRRQLDGQLELADAAISARVAELIAKPAEALAQVALMRSVLGTTHREHTSGYVPTSDIQPPATVLRFNESTIDDQTQLLKRMRKRLTEAAIRPSVAFSFHAALVSGMVPLLSGTEAREVVEIYGQIATGGRLLQTHILPTMVEPADLLGRIDPYSRQFTPHAAGLLDLLIFARKPEQCDKLFLVVLEGVNRAAVDSYLLPILASYRTPRSPEDRRILSLAHPTAFRPGDPYAVAAQLTWPPNVLLAGTLTDGAVRLPLPASLWSDACYIEVKWLPDNTAQVVANTAMPSTSTTHCHWEGWHSAACHDLQAGLKELQHFTIDGVRLPASVAQAFTRIYSAVRPCFSSEQDKRSLKAAVWGVLAPYAVATHQVEALVKVLAVAGIELTEADLRTMQQVLE